MPDQSKSSESRRQVVNFTFFKVMPEWRRLPREERDRQRQEFLRTLERWHGDEMNILSYSLMGMRADADFMLWRICYSLDCLSAAHTDLMKTALGGYLQTNYSLLGMTKRSQYAIGSESDSRTGLAGVVKPGAHKYVSVFPFSKTREWYHMAFEERQRIVHEYTKTVGGYRGVRWHTVYSFGLDDYEFAMALECDNAQDLVDLVMHIRETDNSLYVMRDSPKYTCIRATPQDMLERIG